MLSRRSEWGDLLIKPLAQIFNRTVQRMPEPGILPLMFSIAEEARTRRIAERNLQRFKLYYRQTRRMILRRIINKRKEERKMGERFMIEFMDNPSLGFSPTTNSENLRALEREFGGQFLGYTEDALLAEGSIIPKIFIIKNDVWTKMVRGVVSTRKFYVRRLSDEIMSKEPFTDSGPFICIRIVFPPQ